MRGTLHLRNISFDPAKNARNIEERNLSFERAEDFEPETAMTRLYLRNGELRAFSVAYLDDRLHVLCFEEVEGGIRVISFRRANTREAKRYGLPVRR